MKNFHVLYLDHTTSRTPTYGRKHTLTHSDETGELFLSIGHHYDIKAINWEFRDEVIGEWKQFEDGSPYWIGKAFVSDESYRYEDAKRRFEIFQREMEHALSGIFVGDRLFFAYHPQWLNAPVYVQYESNFKEFHTIIQYGTPRRFMLFAN